MRHPLLALFGILLTAAAQAAPPPEPTIGWEMDYGPFLSGSLDRDKAVSEKNSKESQEQLGAANRNGLAAKAINVRLGRGKAGVAFDTDLLRYAAGWTGGFLDLSKTHLTSLKGSTALTPRGAVRFSTQPTPGWSLDGRWTDPRPAPFGPLPKQVGRYRGLYVHGDRVVLAYTVGECEVLESPAFAAAPGAGADRFCFTRSFRLSPTRQTLTMLVCRDDPRLGPRPKVALAGTTEGVSLLEQGSNTVVKVTPSARVRVFGVRVASTSAPLADAPVEDPGRLTGGGPRRYRDVQTRGRLGTGNGAYVVDTLTLPADNPWHAWMRPSGLDFFSDGRLAVCTLNGDVWVVSGVDGTLERLRWQRFATGLYEPLGLKVVEDKLYVLGRDQITRLHDLNGDGEADFYENFNNDAVASANYHGFAFDLATDSKGDFYYTRAGQRMHSSLPHHGAMLRVSRDGSKSAVIASGLRAANGIGIGPGDLITAGDNQGNWTPTSRINVIRRGGFYGYTPQVTAGGVFPQRTDYDPPLCWIPVTVDNSSGSQVWSDPKRFGPLGGRMFHTSYGKASLMLVMAHKLDDGLYQGGVMRMPFRFDSGVMRGRVNPKDGQLYLCGLRGWQTDGARDGALCRVRYTGKPVYMPLDCRVVPGGLEITFSAPLDRETAEDTGSYGIEQWNYKWSADYGSPEFSVKDPKRQGRDEVAVASAKLSQDRKTVFLSVPDLTPVMQMQVDVDVDAEDGTNIKDRMWLTIHRVPGTTEVTQ
jgi:hypothetical protein